MKDDYPNRAKIFTQVGVTLLIVGFTGAVLFLKGEVPEWLIGLLGGVIGYWFK